MFSESDRSPQVAVPNLCFRCLVRGHCSVMDAILWTAGIALILLGAWMVMAPRFVPLGILLLVAGVFVGPFWVAFY